MMDSIARLVEEAERLDVDMAIEPVYWHPLEDLETTGKKIAVLGDMFELGENAEQYHYEVGKYVATKKIDELVDAVVGELAIGVTGDCVAVILSPGK